MDAGGHMGPTLQSILDRNLLWCPDAAVIIDGDRDLSWTDRIDDGIGLWDGHDLKRLTMFRVMGRDGG